MLLLSGTPEQPGEQGHFARLRLLDAERHADLDAFHEESRGFAAVADLVDQIAERRTIADDLRAAARFETIEGAIVGKALYDGELTLESALAACRGEGDSASTPTTSTEEGAAS